jgi:hypothetical protein
MYKKHDLQTLHLAHYNKRHNADQEKFGQNATMEEETNYGIVLSVKNTSRIASSRPRHL